MPVLNMNDWVYVTLLSNRPALERDAHGSWYETKPNGENQPLIVAWNGRETKLEIDKKTFVQLEAACNAFGDPRSLPTAQAIPIGDPANGERLFIPDRAAEVRRLRLRYSIQDGNDQGFENVNGTFMAPRVKMETENGEEIIPVLEDPDGKTVTQIATTISESENTDAMIAHLTRQVEALKAMVEKQNSATSPLDELESDSDPHPPPSFATLDEIPGSLDTLPDDT